ncbi:heat shock 70 kDa protein 14-A-like [Haliotis rubra]|uniref:heat shock 70 kDa protein 14-A-like n=1 Tax=Haliotis rubra TaxID=36100 RepID=UPI001EE5CD1C|nr:heat shock 70 kDa protein 14-A-like [Haliotis rubra]
MAHQQLGAASSHFKRFEHWVPLLRNTRLLISVGQFHGGVVDSQSGSDQVKQLLEQAFQLASLLGDNGISARARHIPGCKSVWQALSQGRANRLQQSGCYIQKRSNFFVTVTAALWSTCLRLRFNTQLPLCVSPIQIQRHGDSAPCRLSWEGLGVCAFPPPVLLPAVIAKVSGQRRLGLLLVALVASQNLVPQICAVSPEEVRNSYQTGLTCSEHPQSRQTSTSRSEEQQLLCPVRALKIYIAKSSSRRQSRRDCSSDIVFCGQSYALVYRLGGTSSDATILKIENGMYRVCSSTADNQFGGNQFTEVLLKYLAMEFKRQYKADVTENKRSVTKLRLAAETCKHALSTLGNAKCAVESLYDGMDFHHGVSRARFESLCTNLLQQGNSLIEKCLTEAGLNKTDISKVILCGGGAKVPIVQKSVADTVKGAEVLTSISPDEVIAMGAAKEAAFLVGKEIEDLKDHEEHTQARCLSSCVCVKVSDDPETDNLITSLPKLSLIPSRKQHTFTLADAQDNFSMEVYEASDPPTLQNSSLLARIVMRDLPTPSSIQANFHLRREGTLHVTCQELTSNREESVTIGIS